MVLSFFSFSASFCMLYAHVCTYMYMLRYCVWHDFSYMYSVCIHQVTSWLMVLFSIILCSVMLYFHAHACTLYMFHC